MFRRLQAVGSVAPRRVRAALPAFVAATAFVAGCRVGSEPEPPAAPVDLLGEAAAAETVIHDERVAHNLELLAGDQPDRAIVGELARLGLVPGGEEGRWFRDAVETRSVARSVEPWSLRREEGVVTVAPEDVAVRLAGTAGVTLRGPELVFVGLDLPREDPAGVLRGKVWLVLPADGAPGPGPDGLAAAARLGAAAVVLVAAAEEGDRETTGPDPSGAAAPPLVARWSMEATGRVLGELAGTGVEALRRFATRPAFAPLPLGIATHAEIAAVPERRHSRHLVARLPGREAAGEAALLVAARPASPGEEGRGAALPAAEALAVARAFQALTAPPRRDVLFVFPPAASGGPGLAPLFGPGRWSREGTAGGVVLAAASSAAEALRSPGLTASPLRGLLVGLARAQERPLEEPPAAARLAGTAAGELSRIGIPFALLVTGGEPAAGEGEAGARDLAARPSPAVLDARLAFRAVLRLAEDAQRPPRVEGAAVFAALAREAEAERAAAAAAAAAAANERRPRPRPPAPASTGSALPGGPVPLAPESAAPAPAAPAPPEVETAAEPPPPPPPD